MQCLKLDIMDLSIWYKWLLFSKPKGTGRFAQNQKPKQVINGTVSYIVVKNISNNT